jgi:hypothetical protein
VASEDAPLDKTDNVISLGIDSRRHVGEVRLRSLKAMGSVRMESGNTRLSGVEPGDVGMAAGQLKGNRISHNARVDDDDMGAACVLRRSFVHGAVDSFQRWLASASI